MHYLALCCDYDGTLAEDGKIYDTTYEALQRLRASGRKLLLVTGRMLQDLQALCSRLEYFDRVVCENGAVLFNPATLERRQLCEGPLDFFVQTLRDRGVQPLSAGRAIVAASRPHETIIRETIRELGLELRIVFNKDALMVLPTGVDKASGLRVALAELSLCQHNAVGIGDAENDLALLAACAIGAAVENAVPQLKAAADFVTTTARGAGVVELIEELLQSDMRRRASQLKRQHLPVLRS